MEFKSQKGGRKFAHQGFIYNYDNASTDLKTLHWRCELKDLCKARIHIQDGVVVKFLNAHAHEANPAKILVKQAVCESMKARAAVTLESPFQVINAALQGVPDCAMGLMPSQYALRKTIHNTRKQEAQAPALPTSVIDLEVPESYKVYDSTSERSEKFLLADSGERIPDLARILIFGRERNLDEMKHARTWFCDGTFSITPPLFRQVFVILAEVNGSIHPFLYVLLVDKAQNSYTRMFDMIMSLDEGAIRPPEVIHCDFEQALINSIRFKLPETAIAGCYFHLISNMKNNNMRTQG